MELKFKTDAEDMSTTEPYYDLFDGGYIKPEDLLEEEDAKRVNEAVALIQQFFDEAEEKELIVFF